MAAKSRKANWTESETFILVTECTDNIKLLSGKHGEVTEREKSQFWNKMTERINSVGVNTNRTTDEVIKKWKDLKSQTKKKEQIRRREQTRTGGGEAGGSLKEWEEKIIAIIPDSLLQGIQGGKDLFEEAVKDSIHCNEVAGASLTETVLVHPTNIHVEVERGQEMLIKESKKESKRKRAASDLESAQLEFYVANTALCKAQLKMVEQQHKTLAEKEIFYKEATKKLRGDKTDGMLDALNFLVEQ